MSAHPAPPATRSIRAETAGSSGLALGPNQRGKAAGELEASEKLSQAAVVIAAEPVAITLRYLQTLTEIASEKNSTIVFPLPIEMMHLLKQVVGEEKKP